MHWCPHSVKWTDVWLPHMVSVKKTTDHVSPMGFPQAPNTKAPHAAELASPQREWTLQSEEQRGAQTLGSQPPFTLHCRSGGDTRNCCTKGLRSPNGMAEEIKADEGKQAASFTFMMM